MLFSGNLRTTHLMFSKQALTLIKKDFIVLFIIIIFRKIFLKQQPSMKLNKFLKTKERFGFFSVYFIKYSVQYASKSRPRPASVHTNYIISACVKISLNIQKWPDVCMSENTRGWVNFSHFPGDSNESAQRGLWNCVLAESGDKQMCDVHA